LRAQLPRFVGDDRGRRDRGHPARQRLGLECRPLRRRPGSARRAVLQSADPGCVAEPGRSGPIHPRRVPVAGTVLDVRKQRIFLEGCPLWIGRAEPPYQATGEAPEGEPMTETEWIVAEEREIRRLAGTLSPRRQRLLAAATCRVLGEWINFPAAHAA